MLTGLFSIIKRKNPSITYHEKDGRCEIERLWNDDTFSCSFNWEDLHKLKNLVLPEELIAFHHEDLCCIEFIYRTERLDDPLLKRRFTFNYEGLSFECYFDESSEILRLFAKGFKESLPESESSHRNLRQMRDYYNQDKLPVIFKEYFADRRPFSFFVRGNISSINYIQLCKHLNFYGVL